MARIIETLYRGETEMYDNIISWELLVNKQHLSPSVDPTRIKLILRSTDSESTADDIVVDTGSDGTIYTLGTPGTAETFRYNRSTGILAIDLGGVDSTIFPEGEYLATLYWYDANVPNGLVWTGDVVLVKILAG